MDLDDEELKATRRMNGSDKNVACMEEDIKILENLLEEGFEAMCYLEAQAIEHLIKAYKELKEIEESHRKENGKLRERVKELEEWNEYYRKEMLSKEYIKLNYIPKSKVREKIEELDKEKLKYDNDLRIYTLRNTFDFQKEVLQELLREE